MRYCLLTQRAVGFCAAVIFAFLISSTGMAQKGEAPKEKETKGGKAVTGEAKSGEAKSGEAKTGEAKTDDAKSDSTAKSGKCTEDDIKKVAALNIKATGQYDDYDFEGAKQTLEDAIAQAKRSGCGRHLAAAKSYLYLGVVESGGFKDFEEAKKAWFKAFALFPKIEIPRRMANPRLMRSYARAQALFKVSGGATQPVGVKGEPDKAKPDTRPAEPKGPPQGLEHAPLSEAEETKDLEIKVRVEEALNPGRVTVFYRPDFATSYRKIDMAKKDKWTWAAEIPGKDVRGKVLRYYLVVWSTEGKPIAASGNAASPHLITLKMPGTISSEGKPGAFEENPLTGERRRITTRRTEVPDDEAEIPGTKKKKSEDVRIKRKKDTGADVTEPLFVVWLGTGIGVGLLNGETEVARAPDNPDKGKDLPNAVSTGSLYAHLDLGYFIHRNFSIGAMGRIGKTFISGVVGEEGQSNYYDWLVLGRVRYLSKTYKIPKISWMGWKWFVGGGLGYGYVRHHIKANDVLVGGSSDQISVTDTDRAKGFIPNAFGGAELVFLDGRLNVFLEANYLATFSSNPDDNLYFHLDFTLGVGTEF